jgi:WD40 repeat protein
MHTSNGTHKFTTLPNFLEQKIRQEFSNHIIELGMLKKDRTVKEVIKNYYPSDSVKNSVIKRKHDSDLERIYYFEQIKQIIAIERDSPSFQVYTYQNPKLVCDIQGHKGPILGAEMVNVEGSNLLATTSIDLTINFWDPQQNFKLKQIISTPEIQQVLRYCQWNENAPHL